MKFLLLICVIVFSSIIIDARERIVENGPKLMIKSLPAAPKKRSDLYEIYQIAPYRYVEKEKKAVVRISSSVNNISGVIHLSQKIPPLGSVELRGFISGLKAGKHGIHVNQLGDIRERCLATGAHYNPYNFNHGSPDGERRHAGDLGNIEADVNGVAEFTLSDQLLSLSGSRSIIGRSIVIDYVEDDFAKNRGMNRMNSKTAVFPAACGVIGTVE